MWTEPVSGARFDPDRLQLIDPHWPLTMIDTGCFRFLPVDPIEPNWHRLTHRDCIHSIHCLYMTVQTVHPSLFYYLAKHSCSLQVEPMLHCLDGKALKLSIPFFREFPWLVVHKKTAIANLRSDVSSQKDWSYLAKITRNYISTLCELSCLV